MTRRPPHAERGAALLTAMIIVTLVASLAAAMVWRQYRAVQIEAAERARAQSAWILQGALDWARLILLPILLPNVRHFPMLEDDRFPRLATEFLEVPDVSKLEVKERWRRRTR